MNAKKSYLAIDLGAESGRAVVGVFDGGRLSLEEVHRFSNMPVSVRGRIYWDILNLFREIKRGLAMAAKVSHAPLISLGVDTWGVDYGLIDAKGDLLGNPIHYRDSRTDGMMEEAFRRVPKREIYGQTGIQFMFFNTLFQILSESVQGTSALGSADRLLFVPDLINYWLTGAKVNERTIASTSQMYDPVADQWTGSLLEAMGIPSRIFGEIVPPGTRIGALIRPVAEETGAGPLAVVAPGCHDTASAVAAVPAKAGHYAYLSSGTWSLMGIESPKPVITDRTFDLGFTNEMGVCDSVRVLKNISGLWLVQESRRIWAAGGEDLSYEELTRMAQNARPFSAFIDPDYPAFAAPGDMPGRIAEFCRRTGQEALEGKGAIIRTALESLALRYRTVFTWLEEIADRRLEPLHIVGGGTKNWLLNQFAANALNRTVIAGPVEATSAGNILMQMIGVGDLHSLAEGRELVTRSFSTEVFEPTEPEIWNHAYDDFLRVSA